MEKVKFLSSNFLNFLGILLLNISYMIGLM